MADRSVSNHNTVDQKEDYSENSRDDADFLLKVVAKRSAEQPETIDVAGGIVVMDSSSLAKSTTRENEDTNAAANAGFFLANNGHGSRGRDSLLGCHGVLERGLSYSAWCNLILDRLVFFWF